MIWYIFISDKGSGQGSLLTEACIKGSAVSPESLGTSLLLRKRKKKIMRREEDGWKTRYNIFFQKMKMENAENGRMKSISII